MNELDTLTQSFPVVLQIPVQWGDMDAAQHVNNVVYLRWAESARIHFMQQLGVFVNSDAEEGVILGWQDCKYIFPVTYPDTIHIGVRVTDVLDDRFMMESHLFSQQHQRLVAISSQRMVPYNYKTLRKIPMPARWRESIESLSGS